LLALVLNVPLVKVIVLATESADPSVHTPPTPLNVTLSKVFPLVVIVLPLVVELKFILDRLVVGNVVGDIKDKLPYIDKLGAVPAEKVQLPTEVVRSRQLILPVITIVPTVVPLPVATKTLSAEVGTDAPTVAAVIVCEAYVPPTETTQVFTDPLEIVPRDTFVLENTFIPTTNAGEPTVVKVVPEQDAVNDSPCAADQFVVVVVSHVPLPPTQYRFATVYSCGGLVTMAYHLS